jgi:hypothetical protein
MPFGPAIERQWIAHDELKNVELVFKHLDSLRQILIPGHYRPVQTISGLCRLVPPISHFNGENAVSFTRNKIRNVMIAAAMT